MSKKTVQIIVTICMLVTSHISSSWDMYSFDKNLFVGNIVFPQNVKPIPQISLYRRGIQIKPETDHAANKIQFTISEDKACSQFYTLITKNVKANIEDNTIQNLTVDPSKNPKLYRIQLVHTNRTSTHLPSNKSKEKIEESSWKITELKVHKDGTIPDNTLIVIFNPDYVEKLEGGNNLELPKIIIKKNILELAGSQKKLLEETEALIMGSIDFLTLSHIKPKPEIKLNAEKKVVVVMASPTDSP